MTDGPVDLSPLDPSSDAARWERMLASTVARAQAANDARTLARSTPLGTIAGWRRELLVAAAAAIAMLMPLEFALELSERREQRVHSLAQRSAAWAESGVSPSGADILRGMTGGGAR